MSKPRRAPNKTERLAAVLLMLKRGDGWLIPEPLRSEGTAAQICAYPEWHHEVPFAIRPHNDPRLLTPLSRAEHGQRFAADMAAIAKVKRGIRKRSGQAKRSRPMPGSKSSPWKRRMDGTTERRIPR